MLIFLVILDHISRIATNHRLMMESISALLPKLPLLNEALSDSPTPTPGYMLQKINGFVLESESSCKYMALYFIEKLKCPSHHIKLKVLKTMKHVSENGNVLFRQILRGNSSSIKPYEVYAGLPDELHGDAFIIAIREAAKDLMAYLFDTEMMHMEIDREKMDCQKSTTQMDAISGSRSNSKLPGFGSSFPVSKGGILDTLQASISKLAVSAPEPDPVAEAFTVGGYEQPAGVSTLAHRYNTVAPTTKLGATSFTRGSVPRHRVGRPGGGWDDEEDENVEEINKSSDPSHKRTPLIDLSDQDSVEGRNVRSPTKSKNEAYAEFLREFATTNKLPLRPSFLKIAAERCQEMNHLILTQEISKYLESSDEQLMILFLLESLYYNGILAVEQLYHTMPVLEKLIRESSDGIKAKAEKLFCNFKSLREADTVKSTIKECHLKEN